MRILVFLFVMGIKGNYEDVNAQARFWNSSNAYLGQTPPSDTPKIFAPAMLAPGEYVTPDNKYLFFSYGHSPKDCAIYWIRFDNLLENLKHTNFEPYVKDSIKPQSGSVGNLYSLHINENTFYDDDGNNTLTYTATLSDGKSLPSWLKFDPKTKSFSGTPADMGTYDITLTATDNAKATASSKFLLTVNN